MDPQHATWADCQNPPAGSLFDTLVRDCRKMKPGVLAREIDYVIDAGRVNADESNLIRDCDEWHRIAIESIAIALSEREYQSNKRLLAWFARRGVSF